MQPNIKGAFASREQTAGQALTPPHAMQSYAIPNEGVDRRVRRPTRAVNGRSNDVRGLEPLLELEYANDDNE